MTHVCLLFMFLFEDPLDHIYDVFPNFKNLSKEHYTFIYQDLQNKTFTKYNKTYTSTSSNVICVTKASVIFYLLPSMTKPNMIMNPIWKLDFGYIDHLPDPQNLNTQMTL
jgi:hypothetical protein